MDDEHRITPEEGLLLTDEAPSGTGTVVTGGDRVGLSSKYWTHHQVALDCILFFTRLDVSCPNTRAHQLIYSGTRSSS